MGLTFRMPVAERRLAHVRQLDVGFRARIHKLIAMCWMKLGGSDNFCQLFHIHRFDIHDIWITITVSNRKRNKTNIYDLKHALKL